MSGNFRTEIAAVFLCTIILTAIPSVVSAAILGRWKLDEGTGSTATDSSGNNKNGTWSGTSSGNTGYYDTNATSSLAYSGSFSSGDDQVLVTGITTVVKSVTFWAYIPNLDGTTEMVSKSSSGQGFEVIINGGTIQFYTMGSDVVSASASSGDIDLNAWNHIVATYNGGGTTMRLYINGDLSGSTGTAPATVTNVENLYFGTWGSGGRQFVGKLNDVRLYDVELTETQVENVMGGSVDPDTPPDTTAPTVGITVPESGASVGSGNITVTATSTDGTGVSGVKFYYDTSNQIGSEITSTSSPNTYTTTWNTTAVSEGSHTLIAVARDAAGNRATSTAVTVTVDKTSPTISAIATSSITSSGGTITWTTSEAASSKVVYSVDTNYASTTTETDTSTRVTSHSVTLSNLLTCTLYNFRVVSRDAATNAATSTAANSFTTTGCSGGATPTSATSTVITVSSAATSTVTDNGRTLQVETPANFTATSSTVVVQIKGLASDTVLGSIGKPSNSLSSAAGIVFNVTALINNVTELDSFDVPVTVSYTYTDADISGLDESTLSMYHYADSAWSELDECSVNTSTNTITCEAPHFSIFAIFGAAPSSSSSASGGGGSTTFMGKVHNLIASGNYVTALALLKERLRELGGHTVEARTLPVRDLETGMTGEDVLLLQKLLNQHGYVLAPEGPGSPGNETDRFGALTRSALSRYQKDHSISPAAGYFGPKTREHMKNNGLGVWW